MLSKSIQGGTVSDERMDKRGVKTILVPIDFSDCSQDAFRYATMVAKTFDAEIVLVHVIDTMDYFVSESVNWSEVYARLEAIVKPLMEQNIGEADKKGVATKGELIQGVPYDQIVKKAREVKANLIVMGTHGRTGIKHLLIGSVAERVVRTASCPVLTVR